MRIEIVDGEHWRTRRWDALPTVLGLPNPICVSAYVIDNALELFLLHRDPECLYAISSKIEQGPINLPPNHTLQP
jgi:hypothetical protein